MVREIAVRQLTHLLKKYKGCTDGVRAEIYKIKAKELIQYEKDMGFD